MFGTRLIRFVRRHRHLAVVCLMLPMILLNGHVITGCGCTGHFEAVCHCHCGTTCCMCCGKGGTCTCCSGKSLACCRPADHENVPIKGTALQGHHCIQSVTYVVVPATIAPASVGHHSPDFGLVLAPLALPLAAEWANSRQVVQWDTGPPPNDLVVTFHRLII
jgi:hypothetical protein